ncbi:MAG: hypothetical protein CMP05_10160 [Xanthomarina sp.]|uniref:hypothetical protein n=1 Tax=Xanthomarina sp. TaxID=1931211 RepID=UPI000C5BFE66|nr:hypothetical protein [Xanthomarina sp.]MBF62348.1 hypothetical protein [Xanthomarina sp.]HAB27719.1 hypothetical protein [Xanthomarina gelatinilytica]HAI17709.1 hypothetical protein [Xanthomarina gelatinilytica]
MLKNTFGKQKKRPVNKDVEKTSAYLNMVNVAGQIKEIYLQENEDVRSIFEEMLKPYGIWMWIIQPYKTPILQIMMYSTMVKFLVFKSFIIH